MNRVVLDQAALAKLRDLKEQALVCDETGQVFGYFSPAVERALYQNVKIPISEEELQRREQELGGRTLAEILYDLKKKG